MTIPKNTICLWYDKDAEAAATFYAQTLPDSAVRAVHRAPSDFPGGKAGDVLTVEFTVVGIPCLGLNGGPVFPHTEAFSFQIATDGADRAVGKGPGIEMGRFLRILVIPQADRVLGHCLFLLI